MPNCLFGMDLYICRNIWMSPTTAHLARCHSDFITIFYDDSVLDSVGELVSQAHIRNTLFFIASSVADFANTLIYSTLALLSGVTGHPNERIKELFGQIDRL